MITIDAEEAMAFDCLAILEVKCEKFPNNEVTKNSWWDCFDNIKEQLGDKVFYEVYASKEYKSLKDANILTFDAVEKARHDGDVTAKEVDDCNIKRYEAKKALQKKFFGEELKEFKN